MTSDEVRRHIKQLNALQRQHQFEWFVCDDCQQLCLYRDQSPGDVEMGIRSTIL